MWRLRIATGSEDPLIHSLNDNVGRQIWEYEEGGGTADERFEVNRLREHFTSNRWTKRHSADALMRLQFATEKETPKLPHRPAVPRGEDPTLPFDQELLSSTLTRGVRFYGTLQAQDGHWPGDYGGPMFLMPGMLISLLVCGQLDKVLSKHHKHEMIRYLFNHQNDDGGWGVHIEGHSTMFGSVLSYVSLRILGVPLDNPLIVQGRRWILDHGSATHITSWGKFWLCVLGVYDWAGTNPLPPEIWLLPYILPFHPGRMWCHCRMVYLPMCYLYGRRAVGDTSLPLVQSLREELYNVPYRSIKWSKMRNKCAKEDLYYPHPWIQDRLWDALYHVAEPILRNFPGRLLRGVALREVMKHVHYEDENTRYICIGPVNKVINMLCCWFEDPTSEAFQRHLPRLQDYLWVAEDGMKMQGYNGSQLWDTAFAVQALVATGMPEETGGILRLAHDYIHRSQVQEDCPGDLGRWYRHISKGAWPFSTRDHGWPISDCTSEGIKAALALAQMPPALVGEAIPARRMYDSIDVILSFQNADGGMATYENTRSYPWLEIINPAETFGDIVIDYCYVECTSACITALAAFAKEYPFYRTDDVRECMRRARAYIVSTQREDGSWYGSWGVCFTYAVWFGITGLVAAGARYKSSLALRKAVSFLLCKQLPGGGWGESYLSCQDKVYTNLPGDRAHLVNTSWALLALIESGQADRDPGPLHAAARVLVEGQMSNGDFPQEEIMGVFNRNCMISYSAYRNIFPLWALGSYKTHVVNRHK